MYKANKVSSSIWRSLGVSTFLLSALTTAFALPPQKAETERLVGVSGAESIAGSAGASSDSGSERTLLAARDCRDEECGPPQPPDEEPPDPDNQPPTPPPPEIIREITVPVDFISNTLKLGLFGTVLQVSHTGGDRIPFWAMVERCESAPNPGIQECIERCNDTPPKQRGQCLDQCKNHNQTCSLVCGSHEAPSFLQWGANARNASSKQQCDANTCPACVPATQVPSLRDIELPVQVFSKTIDPWPLPKYTVTCKINRFQFRAEYIPETGKNVQVGVSADGVTMTIPGLAGSPAIRCDGAPDIYVDDPALKLSLGISQYGLAVLAKAELAGTFSVQVIGDVIVDEAIKGKFTELASNRLNAPDKRALFLGLLRSLTDEYIRQNHLDPRVGEVSSIRFSESGMTVRYLMAPW